jgi:hypothetical protein
VRRLDVADVTGPISTLPGSAHPTPEGTVCDFHPDRPAYTRIQGETDSFGCEMHDVCKECAQEISAERRNRTGDCEWCKARDVPVTDARDYDEGMNGRVYTVCKECKQKQIEELKAEFDPYDDYDEPDPMEEAELECGLGGDGQCSLAGSEHCDFVCPFRESEDFAGSAAWRAKRETKT